MSPERKYSPDYIDEINELMEYDVENWRDITEDWDSELKMIAREARKFPLEERSDRAWREYLGAQTKKREVDKEWAESISIIWNLTDEALDMVIESFD